MIPPTLEANPLLSKWVRVEPGGFVRVAFGKVEYGQGSVTTLAQIAAEELDVPFEKLKVTNAATDAVPDEGLTVGSMSIESSGASVRAACAEVRRETERGKFDPKVVEALEKLVGIGSAP